MHPTQILRGGGETPSADMASELPFTEPKVTSNRPVAAFAARIASSGCSSHWPPSCVQEPFTDMTCSYLGGWGNFGGLKQKGIVTYGLSANRQNPMAGAAHAAVFNVWRRFSRQILYIAPPFVAMYYAMEWAIHRNHYLNSKQGRAEFGEEE